MAHLMEDFGQKLKQALKFKSIRNSVENESY